MKGRVVTPLELGPGELDRWRQIQAGNPDLLSPYFCPEFSLAVGRVCDDARVAVLEDGDTQVGFFPFQQGRLGIGRPMGRSLSDYQGLIISPDAEFNAQELLRQSGLSAWEFDHLLVAQRAFAPSHADLDQSPVLDLSQGFDAYIQMRRAAGARRIAQLQRKARKLEREIGGLEFVMHDANPEVLDYVIEMKSRQCRRSGTFDFFSRLDWTVPLVRQIQETQSDGFYGALSVLKADGRIAAAHFGMRSARAVHWWFPVYDPDGEFSRYSPGGILLLRVAEAAAEMGIGTLDLGKGADPYKASFMTGGIQIAEGVVELPTWRAALHRTRRRAGDWLRTSPYAAPLRKSARALRALKPRRSGSS